MDIQSLSSPVTAQTKVEPAQQAPQKVEKLPESSVVSPTQKTQQETGSATSEQLSAVNVQLEKMGIDMAFTVDENTQSSVIKVIDKTTDEIIKQFPSEDSLRVMKNIQEYLNSVQNSAGSNKDSLTGSLLSEII